MRIFDESLHCNEWIFRKYTLKTYEVYERDEYIEYITDKETPQEKGIH